MKNSLFLSALFTIVFVPVFAQDDNEFHLDKSYTVSKTGTIKLSTDDADVFIEGSDRNDIHVKIDRVIESRGIHWGNKEFDISVELIDGDIIIRDREWGNRSMVGYIREEYTIHIEAPASMLLDIKGDDGDYEIAFMAGDVRIVADDGNIFLNHCTGSSTYFDLDDGDVVMEGGRGKLSVNMDDGDIEISNASFSSINMDIDDGDVELHTSLDDNGEYIFHIEDGRLMLSIINGGGEFDIRHDDGNIRYDSSFKLIDEDDDFAILILPGGNASIKVRGDDTSVSLRTDD